MNPHFIILRVLGFSLLAFFVLILIVPWFASAQGLVPCRNNCTTCDIFVLVQNIVNFIWNITVPLAILFFLYGGILMIVPGFGGEKSAATYQRGKKILTNTLIGIVIIFVAWLAIDYFIKLLGGRIASDMFVAPFGPWNRIQCN